MAIQYAQKRGNVGDVKGGPRLEEGLALEGVTLVTNSDGRDRRRASVSPGVCGGWCRRCDLEGGAGSAVPLVA